MGRPLRLECIRDSPNCKRVRVPEKLVNFLCGEAKKTRDGNVNSLRRARGSQVDTSTKKTSKNKTKRDIPSKLNDVEFRAMERAARKGYVTLAGTAFRRGRRASPLANAHREWCDLREMPQIILCKATGGRPLDNVIVDLSPLRLHGAIKESKALDDVMIKWKSEILIEAEKAGMVLRDDYIEDNTVEIPDNNEFDEEEIETEFVVKIEDFQSWVSEPIWKLPCVSLGIFEGQRIHAKAMANSLAKLWVIPEGEAAETSEREHRPKNKEGKNKGKTKKAAENRAKEHW